MRPLQKKKKISKQIDELQQFRCEVVIVASFLSDEDSETALGEALDILRQYGPAQVVKTRTRMIGGPEEGGAA